jgi:hypothetical protein
MGSTSALILLMTGAAFLGGCIIYFIYKNRCSEYKDKLNALNEALVVLQNERADLMVKNDNMFVENATQSRVVEEMKLDIKNLNRNIKKLEYDNHLLNDAYRTLEHYVQ